MKRLFIILSVVLMLLLLGCNKKEITDTNQCAEYLPKNATSIVYFGNGWYTFYLGRQKFLFHHADIGYNGGYESLTLVN